MIVVVTFFDDVRITLYFGTFELRMEITLERNYVSFWLVIATYCLLRHNQVIYLLVVVTFFDNVRITLYFSTFELHTEITLQNGHFLVTFVWNKKMTKNYVIIT